MLFARLMTHMCGVIGVSALRRRGGEALLVEPLQIGDHERVEGLLQELQFMQETRGSLGWTEGVTTDFKAVVQSLTKDVSDQINSSHHETQRLVNEKVMAVRDAAEAARKQKDEAGLADEEWDSCIGRETQQLQKVVSEQNGYKDRTRDTEEPCQREVETENVSFSTESVKLSCFMNQNEDGRCTAEEADFTERFNALKQLLVNNFSAAMGAHRSAEEDCAKANDAQQKQRVAVTDEQQGWKKQHSECQESKSLRDERICQFGMKLQHVCQAREDYERLVGKAMAENNSFSVSDRIAEWNATQLAICLLESFEASGSLDEGAIDKCQDTISVDFLTLDLQFSTLETILAGPGWAITCADQEAFGFHGRSWDIPDFTPAEYDGTVPSPENATLPLYVSIPGWTTKFSLDAGADPFKECSKATKLPSETPQ